MRAWAVIVDIGHHDKAAILELDLGARIQLSTDNGVCYLESDEFESLQNFPEVEFKAKQLIRTVNGIISFSRRIDKAINFGEVTKRNSFGGRNIVANFQDTVQVSDSLSMTAVDRDGNIVDAWSSERIELGPIMDRATDDIVLQKIFTTISEGWDFVSIYKMLEILQSGRKGKASTVVTKQNIKLLEQTAQPHRHGEYAGTLPKVPMPLAEAKRIVIDLIQEYIDKYSPLKAD